MKFILCFSSMVIIFFSGLYLHQENVANEWRMHQLAYIDLTTPNEGTGQEAYTFGLKQIWLPEIDRADRCISCHVAVEDPHFKNKPNPLKTHPGNYLEKHDPLKYGCTICHDGQGRAVNFRDAAADDPKTFWNKPLLRPPFIQANCYRCHTETLKQTLAYNQGRQMFETKGCLGCHKREGLGGFAGSELAGIGDASVHIKHPQKLFEESIMTQLNGNRNLAYIYEAVRFPGAQSEETVMFDFKLSHTDTMAFSVYLKSLIERQTIARRLGQKPCSPMPIIEKGAKTFQLYCTACHGINAKGGRKNLNYKNDYIPRLNTLAEQMFLHRNNQREAVIAILEKSGDLLDAGPQPDIPGFFKVVAKYMPVKNIILNGRTAEKKEMTGSSPLNMPAWGKTLSEKEISSVIAYLISVY